MSDQANSDSSSGSRRRRRRRGRNRKKRGNNNSNNNSGSGNRNRNRNNRGRKRKSRTPEEKFGGREPRDTSAGENGPPAELNAFELFCAYHLGIFENNSFRQPSLKSVARLFDRSVDEIRDALEACGLDDRAIREADYDLSLAQLDVKVAPEGIDKKELAKNLFDEFVEAHPSFVDWSEAAEESA